MAAPTNAADVKKVLANPEPSTHGAIASFAACVVIGASGYDCDLLRKLFEIVVRRCMAEGLVDVTAFAVDASLIAADANKQRSAAGSDDVDDWEAIARTRRSVREYLDTLDEAAWGAASETVPKFISRSDPAAQWTGAHKGHAFFAYADNYLIDLKAAIIVDVEATRAIRQPRSVRHAQ